jgi:hypothetical protein
MGSVSPQMTTPGANQGDTINLQQPPNDNPDDHLDDNSGENSDDNTS